jgi:pheromone shutdown protein TraB
VVQKPDSDAPGIPVIWPDMTGAQFGKRWRQAVPVTHRLLVWCVVPFYAAGMLLFGTRRLLSRHLAVEDLLTREQEIEREASENVDKLLIDERDALLLEALVSQHSQRSSEEISIGVVYGASHMPAVAAGLLARLGYRAISAEWLTVFGF